METIGFLLIVAAICFYIKDKKDEKLLKENPDAWATKKLVEDESKRRQFETGAHIGMEIAKRILK